ncbi:MAG: aldose 1-epimerase family protein [Planctomycetia bacterium]|nr:aldose 1-epimerase family protein [Planctomycetia bacterium]
METAKYFTLKASDKLQKVDVHLDATTYRHADFRNVSITHKTLRGGPSDGVDMLEISNGQMTLFVMPTRGMGIWKAHVRQGGKKVRVGWHSPVPVPVHPRNVPLYQPDGFGWLRGFNEFVVRCGLESNGAPDFDEKGTLRHPLHGHIANTPAWKVTLEVDDDMQVVRVTGVVREARMFFNSLELESTLTVPFTGTSFRIDDDIENLSARESELELLYHINTGEPVAGDGARLHIPFRRVCPRNAWAATQLDTLFDCHAPTTGEAETCYYYDLAADEAGNTRVFLENASSDFGVSVGFNKNEFPCYCQWKCQHASQDGYVTGMEPALNFPNDKTFEKANGRVVTLAPGAKRHFGLDFQFSVDVNEVAAEAGKIRRLQETCSDPVIEREPIPEWAN